MYLNNLDIKKLSRIATVKNIFLYLARRCLKYIVANYLSCMSMSCQNKNFACVKHVFVHEEFCQRWLKILQCINVLSLVPQKYGCCFYVLFIKREDILSFSIIYWQFNTILICVLKELLVFSKDVCLSF